MSLKMIENERAAALSNSLGDFFDRLKRPRASKSLRAFFNAPHLKAVFPFRKGVWGKTLYFFPKKERVFPQIVPKKEKPPDLKSPTSLFPCLSLKSGFSFSKGGLGENPLLFF